ncbi:MAG: alcohol dehydrogenase catalytic domain-containing protein, partial [Actinocatenispora sp.]
MRACARIAGLRIPTETVAAYLERLGGPEEIRYGMLPVPRPRPTEVLVRVAAVAVNPVDTFVRSGAYRTPVPFPFVIGRDLAGSVVDADPATGFRAGERIWCASLGHAGRQGATAGYVAVAADRLYRLPAGVTDVAAVASLHPAMTAWLALH